MILSEDTLYPDLNRSYLTMLRFSCEDFIAFIYLLYAGVSAVGAGMPPHTCEDLWVVCENYVFPSTV